MRKAVLFFLSLCTLQTLSADQTEPPQEPKAAVAVVPFQPFTGKVARNKVRLRLQPNLDSPILRELKRDDLLAITGESEEFFAVRPPFDFKLYVFRTFVLDDVIEGSKVNVRIEPDLEAPVAWQLNSGDHISGKISALNSKWIEMKPPEGLRFYVSKDYVEKVGDPEMLAVLEKKRDQVNEILTHAYQLQKEEFAKPFTEMQVEELISLLREVVDQYGDFQTQVSKAKELLATVQEAYLEKKIQYLEQKANASSDEHAKISEQMAKDTEQMNLLQSDLALKIKEANSFEPAVKEEEKVSVELSYEAPQNIYRLAWQDQEQALYEHWRHQRDEHRSSLEDFYAEQAAEEIVLQGLLEPYSRPIKNKPGDFVLLSQATGLPIAYLYSTNIDLHSKVKQVVTVSVSPRPNNHFAFPAYFVLTME